MASDPLLEVRRVFLRELSKRHGLARPALGEVRADGSNLEALRTVVGLFHMVAGTAESCGYRLLGLSAATCEDLGRTLLETQSPPSERILTCLERGLEAVEWVLGSEAEPAASVSAADTVDTAVQAPLDTATGEGGASRVFIVDDDPVSIEIAERCLRAAGISSLACSAPSEALERIVSERPDLIILDVDMPLVDGFDLCRQIRLHPALQLAPVIFLSRRIELAQRVRGLEVGGNDYLAKPFEAAELVARVRSHLERLAELRSRAVRDGLTDCFNHRYFKERLSQEVAYAEASGQPLCLAMLDLDHFKRINDAHGHAAGDAVLTQLARIIQRSVRGSDIVARYGGEEFAVLFLKAREQEVVEVAARIREAVASLEFLVPVASEAMSGTTKEVGAPAAKALKVTVSIGVAQLAPGETPLRLLQRADGALYTAKNAGRDQVRVHHAA